MCAACAARHEKVGHAPLGNVPLPLRSVTLVLLCNLSGFSYVEMPAKNRYVSLLNKGYFGASPSKPGITFNFSAWSSAENTEIILTFHFFRNGLRLNFITLRPILDHHRQSVNHNDLAVHKSTVEGRCTPGVNAFF